MIVFLVSQAAESGNVDEFRSLYSAKPERLAVRDGRGRGSAHLAAARDRPGILRFIHSASGGKSLPPVRR